MSQKRRSYFLKQIIIVNKVPIFEIIIDPHVDKHAEHISDEFILSLVELLDRNNYIPSSEKENFSYFVTNIKKQNDVYRVVWLQEKAYSYIGVITAFKDKGASP